MHNSIKWCCSFSEGNTPPCINYPLFYYKSYVLAKTRVNVRDIIVFSLSRRRSSEGHPIKTTSLVLEIVSAEVEWLCSTKIILLKFNLKVTIPKGWHPLGGIHDWKIQRLLNWNNSMSHWGSQHSRHWRRVGPVEVFDLGEFGAIPIRSCGVGEVNTTTQWGRSEVNEMCHQPDRERERKYVLPCRGTIFVSLLYKREAECVQMNSMNGIEDWSRVGHLVK